MHTTDLPRSSDPLLRRRAIAAANHHPGCLGCGTENPAAVVFRVLAVEANHLLAEVQFSGHHDGAPGRVHGGAIATVMDEGLGRLAHLIFGTDCLTASLTVDYKAPADANAPCEFTAELERQEGRKIWVTGRLRRGDVVFGHARALFIQARPLQAPASAHGDTGHVADTGVATIARQQRCS